MPYSYDYFKKEIRQHFKKNISTESRILDVGPGSGTYAKLLNPLGFQLDCVEVWEPYIQQFGLNDLYRKVILGNIMTTNFTNYDYLILGDILEHLSTNDAIKLLESINSQKIKCLIAVPYLYEQDSFEGNKFEIHLQPDLTPEIVLKRYKSLKLLYRNESYGYYTNYYEWSKFSKFKYNTYNLLATLIHKVIFKIKHYIKNIN